MPVVSCPLSVAKFPTTDNGQRTPDTDTIMPPLHLVWDVLANAVLPAAVAAALVFALIAMAGGKKCAASAAALGLAAGVALGLWRRDALTLISPDESPWNRLPLAALGAALVGLLTRLPPALLPAPEGQRRP